MSLLLVSWVEGAHLLKDTLLDALEDKAGFQGSGNAGQRLLSLGRSNHAALPAPPPHLMNQVHHQAVAYTEVQEGGEEETWGGGGAGQGKGGWVSIDDGT